VSNPITQPNATFVMRESADPKDKLIAEMNERLGPLEKSLGVAQIMLAEGTRSLPYVNALAEYAAKEYLMASDDIRRLLSNRTSTIGEPDGGTVNYLVRHYVDPRPG
jgi:hypothetical protein